MIVETKKIIIDSKLECASGEALENFELMTDFYGELNERLSQSKFLAGEEYTIADIATFPWIARHDWHDIGLKKFKNLTRWYKEISKRDAVKRGYDLLNNGEQIPLI